ncbi:hypothetical protein DMN91_004960 [Ooceraea biroi]|uniref:RNB domain-containing protein n=1 Tax=Ooceraea biroi TaxID=2015173 RepID=A0A3L8DQY3_OOCBI|nr:DIS3-like exonuclease 2 [Ooceraea biroi]XP_019885867.2 DIS3-like exonuclease 2 [Ooceraea biroi]RLU22682.1 hypothetical protein DMN91_004960 [Ooceraea biroi]
MNTHENTQEEENMQKTEVDPLTGETSVARCDKSMEGTTQSMFNLNVSPDLRSNNETIGPHNEMVSNETEMHAASTSSAAGMDATLNDVADRASTLSVSLNPKSDVNDAKHGQAKHLSTNNKGKNRITSAENKQNIQNLVQVNTDNATMKKNKKNRKRNKTKATEANESNIENVLNNCHQHKENGRKEIKRDNKTKEKTTKKVKKAFKKTPVFLDYIPVPEMEQALSEQTPDNVQYIKGNLRVNSVCPKFAYLRMEDMEERDLLIVGTRHRNRVFHGDLVVASINPENAWFTYPDGAVQKTGMVVSILEALHPRTAVGYLKEQNSLIMCHPRDRRIPMIDILPESLPPLYLEQPGVYKNTMFYVNIDSWEHSYASGRVLSIVGEGGEIEAELRAIILENNLDVSPYRKELLEGLPNSDILTDDDIKDREDWRNECVFSIDPATAVDIDDLLSCKVLENGNYEVGVHISDVTHYLKFSSLLDAEVSKRATSVYTPHTVYHMLPEELCRICSLHAGKDRLTFSVIWEMTPDAEVVRHRFAKTVVRSCCQMSYDSAQTMIESPGEKSWAEDSLDIRGNYTASALCDVVNKLFKLSSKMRSKRFADGAVRLDQPKLQVRLNTTPSRERRIPTAVNYYVHVNKDSNSLVEEFMLLANMTTAARLHTAIPETAFLRIHRDPFKYPLNSLREMLQKYGIHLDIETAGALHASIHRYQPNLYSDNDPMKYVMMVIITLCSKTMRCAEYVCASTIPSLCGTKHYALNVPLYTHFTSPIRRYPDCVVHRLLSVVIEDKPLPEKWTAELCSRIAANCNVTKYNAKLAQEQSTEVFFAEMVGLAGGFEASAIVSNVKEDNIDVILCDTGIKLKIDLKEIAHTATITYSVHRVSLVPTTVINWKEPPVEQLIELFSFIHVWVEKIDKTLRLKATLLRPE